MRNPGSLPAARVTSIPIPVHHPRGHERYNEMTSDDITKAAVIYMLERGLASYQELAELSGRSRQIIHHWAKDYPDARAEYLKAKWDKAILHSSKHSRKK
jgi:hypothetical protein